MNDVNEMLDRAEAEVRQETTVGGPIQVKIRNKITGAADGIPVLPENTLGQILDQYGKAIGIRPNRQAYFFFNERLGKTTSDSSATVSEFGLAEGDVLGITDEGTVAAE